jgi:hypothetical protein
MCVGDRNWVARTHVRRDKPKSTWLRGADASGTTLRAPLAPVRALSWASVSVWARTSTLRQSACPPRATTISGVKPSCGHNTWNHNMTAE